MTESVRRGNSAYNVHSKLQIILFTSIKTWGKKKKVQNPRGNAPSFFLLKFGSNADKEFKIDSRHRARKHRKAMASLYYTPNRLKKQWLKNKFWFTPVSCRYQSSKCTGRSSDSSHLLRLPSILPVAKNATNITPTMESRYTATGIVPDSHRIPFSPFGQQCGFWAPCALQI